MNALKTGDVTQRFKDSLRHVWNNATEEDRKAYHNAAVKIADPSSDSPMPDVLIDMNNRVVADVTKSQGSGIMHKLKIIAQLKVLERFFEKLKRMGKFILSPAEWNIVERMSAGASDLKSKLEVVLKFAKKRSPK